ncbi:MAG TPA: carboxypeptidase-like regulatory domain-containing protein [Cytophagaceae bacterium]|jgi:hypothetical protein|nr:carboxypeptidase-like regulatory domain-containing protein [Cytophagaceae bacterium]
MKNKGFVQIWSMALMLMVNVTQFAFASDSTMTGTIIDFETKEPLSYTNVTVIGKQKGTISNSEGNFVLDMEGITFTDTVVFQYMGYETVKIKVSELQKRTTVYMYPATVKLGEVQVISSSLSAEEIINHAYKNFKKNHVIAQDKQRIFFHKYGKTILPKENKINLKKTNFVGLDKKVFEELLKKIPDEIIEYQDAIVELYTSEANHKLIPIKGISMEEGSQQELVTEFEKKLGSFFADIDKSLGEKDIYYKVRTGILSQKLGNKNEDKAEWKNNNDSLYNDSLHYTMQVQQAKEYLLSLLKNYSNVESDNLEFINSTNKYIYTIDDIQSYNDESVYKISFTPKKRGLFEGVAYISTSSYALLQLDFSYAKGKQSEVINLFGVQHATNFKEAHVIYEKAPEGYYVKYMNAKKWEFSALDRNFSITKKQKRFLIDKELSEIKLETELSVNNENYWELLVLEKEKITTQQFEKIKEPLVIKFKKEYVYSPKMWENRTVIVPAKELQKYKRNK